jgi:hypothetical protein
MTTTPPQPDPQRASPAGDGLATADLADEGDRISVTDVNGTVARFEMAYSPTESDRFRFGPPMRQRLLSLIFLAFALGMVSVVLYGESSGSGTGLSTWLAEQDRGRPIGSLGLSFVILACALGTVARAQMRGLVIRADGVEARYLLALGVPRICRWTWAQVERIIFDDASVMFELWNGEYERLPEVRDHAGMCELLERIAAGRKIRVTKLPHVASHS